MYLIDFSIQLQNVQMVTFEEHCYYLKALLPQYGKKLDSQKVIEPDWQCYIRDTATIILKCCTSDGLLKVRTRIYDLLTRYIPTYVIFEELLEAFLPHCDATIRRHVIYGNLQESSNFK